MKNFKKLILTVVLAICIGFLNFVPTSMANSFSESVLSSQTYYLMDLGGQVNAKSKKLEGELIETQGKLTNDKGKQLEGKVVQFEGDVMQVTENAEEAIESTSKNIGDGLKELGKKVQKTFE